MQEKKDLKSLGQEDLIKGMASIVTELIIKENELKVISARIGELRKLQASYSIEIKNRMIKKQWKSNNNKKGDP